MNYIREGSENGDLARLVRPLLSIDEYRSKMGDDKDIVVLAFMVFGKEPANDLVNFVEKSYDYVLDADISSGEMSDGNYMVFVELRRNDKIPSHIISMLDDLMNLTSQKVSEWKFTYYKDTTKYEITEKMLSSKMILSPDEYEKHEKLSMDEGAQLNHLRAISGVKVKPAIINDVQLLAMQRSAGIK